MLNFNKRDIKTPFQVACAAIAIFGCAYLAGWFLPSAVLLFILLVALVGLFHVLKSAALAFFLGSLLALILFKIPLMHYTDLLYSQASSLTVFMIILFGGTLALISRSDLPEELKNKPKDEANVRKKIAVFCLLQRFDALVRRCPSRFWQMIFLLPLIIANFISSSAAVLFFKTLWVPSASENPERNKSMAAGILCLCISGCLMVYGLGGFKSTWWIFFSKMVVKESVDAQPQDHSSGQKSTQTDGADNHKKTILPKTPVAVLIYAFLSYIHGFSLIFGFKRIPPKPKPSVSAKVQKPPDKKSAALNLERHYLIALVLCLIVVFGVMNLIGFTVENAAFTDSDKNTRFICTLFIGLILAVLLAQFSIYLSSIKPRENLGNLLLKGMSSVFVTVVTLVIILAFKDIIVEALNTAATPAAASGTSIYWQLCVTVLAFIIALVGLLLGSAWGVFALSFTIFQFAGVTNLAIGRTVVEALILIATFLNQISPNGDNTQMMLDGKNCTVDKVRDIWSVKSWFQLKAGYVQLLFIVIGLSAVTIMRFVLNWDV